jgi:hypothetical protein
MKKLIFIFTFFLFVSIIFIGCKKVSVDDASFIKSQMPIIEAAKNFFVNKILAKEKDRIAEHTLSQKSKDVFTYPRMEIITKLINWDEAKQYDIDSVSYVIAAVKHETKPFTNKSYEAAKFLVFYIDKSDSMQMKIIEILGAAGTSLGSNITEIASTSFSNMYLNKNTRIININANVIFYNDNYISESNFVITSGTWHKGNFKLQNQIHSGIGASSFRSGANLNAIYETWYTIGYWFDLSTGDIVGDPVILNSYQVCISGCDNTSASDVFGDTGCNNCATVPTVTEEAVFDNAITDSLSDCRKKILDSIKTISEGRIAEMIKKFTGDVPAYNWKITERDSSSMEVFNHGALGESMPYPRNGYFETHLNTDLLANSTDLITSVVILHESIHAYLRAYFRYDSASAVLDYPQLLDAYILNRGMDHDIMAQQLRDDISSALKEVAIKLGYENNASLQIVTDDLVWTGLQGTSMFNSLSTIDKDRIRNRIRAEWLSATTNNGISPVGVKACQ